MYAFRVFDFRMLFFDLEIFVSRSVDYLECVKEIKQMAIQPYNFERIKLENNTWKAQVRSLFSHQSMSKRKNLVKIIVRKILRQRLKYFELLAKGKVSDILCLKS